MNSENPLEDQFRSGLSDLTREPPDSVWEKVSGALHPPGKPVPWWKKLADYFALTGRNLVLAIVTSSLVIASGLTVVFIANRGCEIRGHVTAGESRVKGGDADLFLSEDRVMPWDSLVHERSVRIDRSGHFRFKAIPDGSYVLRCSPARGSREAEGFTATYYQGFSTSDSCLLIRVSGEDLTLEADLRPK